MIVNKQRALNGSLSHCVVTGKLFGMPSSGMSTQLLSIIERLWLVCCVCISTQPNVSTLDKRFLQWPHNTDLELMFVLHAFLISA